MGTSAINHHLHAALRETRDAVSIPGTINHHLTTCPTATKTRMTMRGAWDCVSSFFWNVTGEAMRTLHCPTYSCGLHRTQIPDSDSVTLGQISSFSPADSAGLQQTLAGSKFILLIYKQKSITNILNTCYIRELNSQPADFKYRNN